MKYLERMFFSLDHLLKMISKAKTHFVLLFLLFTWILPVLALASSQSFLFWHYNLYNVNLSQFEKDLGCLSNVQPGANKSLLRERPVIRAHISPS